MVRLPRCLSAELYSRQLRMRYAAFFFFTFWNYTILHPQRLLIGSYNKTLFSH